MGSDNLHCLSAWASTFLELDLEMPTEIENRVDVIVDYIVSNSKRFRNKEQLLMYLANEKHESPFRMSGFVFAMTTDIATHIQKLKHKVILEAENAESARYKQLQEKYYLPTDWVKDETLEKWRSKLEEQTKENNTLYEECLNELTPILGRSRAKESARYFKMYNTQLNSINKFSFAGIMLFYLKRNDPAAQLEIREVANQMLDCVKNIPNNPFKLSLQAFGVL